MFLNLVLPGRLEELVMAKQTWSFASLVEASCPMADSHCFSAGSYCSSAVLASVEENIGSEPHSLLSLLSIQARSSFASDVVDESPEDGSYTDVNAVHDMWVSWR